MVSREEGQTVPLKRDVSSPDPAGSRIRMSTPLVFKCFLVCNVLSMSWSLVAWELDGFKVKRPAGPIVGTRTERSVAFYIV